MKLEHWYGFAPLIQAGFLFTTVLFLNCSRELEMLLASCACGLQNGKVRTYSGAVLRTTHVSGLFADIVIFMGRALAGLRVDVKRLRLYSLLIASYFCGIVLDAVGFGRFGNDTLYGPAIVTGGIGLAYFLYKQKHHEHN